MKNIQFKGIGHPQHGFGLIPDPPGHRYNGFHLHPAAQLRAAALPSASSNLRFAPDVWNQGQTGSCFGHGMAGQITTTIAAHGKPLPSPVRPRVVYAFTRAIDRVDPSVPLQDSGSQPNSGVRALSLWGCVLEGDDDGGRTATSPDYTAYLETHVNDDPKLGEIIAGQTRRLVGFNSIADSDSQKSLKYRQALATGHTIGVGVDAGGDAFQGYDVSKGPLDFTGSSPDHWVFIVDYATALSLRQAGSLPAAWSQIPDTAILFLLQNSWGTGLWTKTGRAWVTENFVNRGCFMSLVTNLSL
jgi:hypothetical protein